MDNRGCRLILLNFPISKLAIIVQIQFPGNSGSGRELRKKMSKALDEVTHEWCGGVIGLLSTQLMSFQTSQ